MCPTCGAELAPVPTRESKPLIPTSVYAITKRDHEELCQVVGLAYGIPTVALRFFNVYGPGQALSNPYTGVAAIFSSRLLNDHAPLVFEDGLQSRDFIHVSDIVRAIVLALDSDAAVGHAINVGTGRPTSVGEVARADRVRARQGASRPSCRARTERATSGTASPTRRAPRSFSDSRRSCRLEDGIGELLDWVRTQTATDRVDEAAAELVARRLVR